MNDSLSPTQEFYSLLEKAYDVFNNRLFEGQLTNCLLTVQREKKTMGYFSRNRWVNTKGDIKHEIALNPSYFARHKVIEIFQTLVHEQCHLWQFEFGNASRPTYHNKEWAEKMESIGLMPTNTGLPGGRKTGQKMGDYAIPGGEFLNVSKELINNGISITWFDRITAKTPATQSREGLQSNTKTQSMEQSTEHLLYSYVSELIPNKDDIEEPMFQIAAKNISKIKYSCRSCSANVWGKPQLSVICGNCNQPFEVD